MHFAHEVFGIDLRIDVVAADAVLVVRVEALADDVYCLVTYNSVSAVEAVMLGKPAITLGPNAATVVSNSQISDVEKLSFPDDDLRQAWLRHLSYSQFTFTEMSDGTAWKILNS
jgi:hypothetical protein